MSDLHDDITILDYTEDTHQDHDDMKIRIENAEPEIFPIREGQTITVGRDQHQDIVINDPKKIVSRKHLEFERIDDQITIEVKGLNGIRIFDDYYGSGASIQWSPPIPFKIGDCTCRLESDETVFEDPEVLKPKTPTTQPEDPKEPKETQETPQENKNNQPKEEQFKTPKKDVRRDYPIGNQFLTFDDDVDDDYYRKPIPYWFFGLIGIIIVLLLVLCWFFIYTPGTQKALFKKSPYVNKGETVHKNKDSIKLSTPYRRSSQENHSYGNTFQSKSVNTETPSMTYHQTPIEESRILIEQKKYLEAKKILENIPQDSDFTWEARKLNREIELIIIRNNKSE